MKKLLLVAAIAAAWSTHTRADDYKGGLRLEIATGQCRYGASPDGMFWNSDQEHTNRYKTNGCTQFGLQMDAGPLFSVSARYVNLGSASLDALAIPCPGDDCSRSNPALDKRRPECASKFTEDCLYRWRGAGGIKGVNFAAAIRAVKLGDFSVEPEAGLFVYRMTWSAQVYPLGCTAGQDSAGCPWRINVDQRTSYYVSPEVGLTVRYKYLFVGTQYFFRTTQHTPITAGIGGPAQTWIAGVQIPLWQ